MTHGQKEFFNNELKFPANITLVGNIYHNKMGLSGGAIAGKLIQQTNLHIKHLLL